MEFKAKSGSPEKQRSGCLVVAVFEDGIMSPAATQINKNTKRLISSLIKRGDVTGKSENLVLLPNVSGVSAERILQ